jgi:ubiquinone/menaquinone biosynthesis C-methylase UbiE
VTKNTTYSDVIAANIEVHSRLAESYSTCEPHFRPENVEKVERRLAEIIQSVGNESLLDLGCGTGFIINIAKRYVSRIVGVDVTQAMLDKVDTAGPAAITLYNHDTGSFPVEEGSFDAVTAYSFLHHLYDIRPTLETAFKALRPGGKLYADLEPNYYFWKEIHGLERDGAYDPIIRREIEMVAYKDEDIEKQFGVAKDTFNKAEYGKNIAGGLRDDALVGMLTDVGFAGVDVFFQWFVGQGDLINDSAYERDERFRYAEITDRMLQRALPLSRPLFKYLGFVATK